MGMLAALAEQHWRKFRPQEYKRIKNKATFFQGIEDQAAEEIENLTVALAGPDQPGEDFQETAARYLGARMQAESQVMRETVLPDPSPDLDPDRVPTDETMRPPPDQTDRELAAAIADFWDAAAEQAEIRRTLTQPQTGDPNQPQAPTPPSR